MRSTVRRAMRRGEDGQILPALVIILLALLAVGAMMFQVGSAAVLRSEAQTAADAAALAGAEEIKRQLIAQWATYGTTDLQLLNQPLVIAKMDEYARKNGGRVVARDIKGVDVKATVVTLEELGDDAKAIDQEDAKGEAKARARLFLVPGLTGAANIGPLPGGGGGYGPAPEISGKEWKELAKELGDGAPGCDDIVTLGRFLQDQGFGVSENAFFGGVNYEHASAGYHYKCGNAGALDVNYGGAGDLNPAEVAAVDPIIADLR